MENDCLGLAQMEYSGAPLEVVHVDPLTSQTKICNSIILITQFVTLLLFSRISVMWGNWER